MKNKIVGQFADQTKKNLMNLQKKYKDWARKNTPGLFVLNILVIFMVLLGNAGYFDPFVRLSVNIIMFMSFLFAILIFRLKSQILFYFSILFLIITGLLLLLEVEVWAERAALYFFELLFLGILLLIYEEFVKMKRNER